MANDLSNSFQTLRSFAELYRLKLSRDECGDLYIPGRCGQLYEYAPGRLAVLFLGATPRQWNAARKKLEAAGFEITHDADTEGIALFDPTDAEQCRVAIQVVKAKPRRVLSPAQHEQLQAATAKAVVSRNRKTVRASEVSGADSQPPGSGTTLGPSREGLRKTTKQPPAPDVAGDAGDRRRQS